MAICSGHELYGDGAGIAYGGGYITTARGDGGESSEFFTRGSRAIGVDPGLCERANLPGCGGVGFARLPEAQCGGLLHVRISASHVDNKRIGGYLHIRGKAHSATVFDE